MLHIALLLLTLVLLMSLFDWVYTYTYANAVPRNKFQYIHRMRPQAIDYVFLGSSRVADHISATEVRRLTGKTAINLGIEGASYDDNLLELQMLLARKVTIKKVILIVDHFYELQGASTFGNAAMLPFIHDPMVTDHFSRQLPDFRASYYVPFYRYMKASHVAGFREFFMSAMGRKTRVDFSDGLISRVGNTKLKVEILPDTLSQRNKCLDSIQAICDQNQIELVLFCAPYCSKVQNLDYIAKLKQRYPAMLDYSRTMDDKWFYDCAHLNKEGAIEFTRMLVEKCCEN
jgi:hypothetical protein